MPTLFLIENEETTNIFPRSNEVFLHEDILDVLFKYKGKLSNIFDDIRGTFFIDHFAINIIDPNNKIVIFSTTPSVEYNLISTGLWKYDKSFSAKLQMVNVFCSWEEAYEEEYFERLKLTKQNNHGFSYGFNIFKIIGSFQFIYSFATRCQKHGLQEYYRKYINELFSIGDYCYKAISGIYDERFGKIIPARKANKDQRIRSFSPFLTIITGDKRDLQ